MGGYFAGSAEPRRAGRHARPRDACAAWAAGSGCGAVADPHRGLPGGRRGSRSWPTSTARTPASADPASTARRRCRRSPRRCATGWPPTRTSPDWSGGRWCSAAVAPAPPWTPRRTSRPACFEQFPQLVARHLAGRAIRAAPVRSARCGPTRWRRLVSGHEDPARPHAVRRFRHLRQTCSRSTSRSTTGGTRRWSGDGTVPEDDRDAVMRALLDCPVHAIIE